MAAALPDDVPEEVKKLGPPLAVFRSGITLALCAGGFMALLGAFFGVPAVVTLCDLDQWRGPHLAGILKMAILGLGGVAFGTTMLYRGWRGPRARVFVCPDGIAWVEGGRAETVRWEDVNSVRKEDHDTVRRARDASGLVSGLVSYNIVLEKRDGGVLVLNENVSGLNDLQQLVREHTLKWMLPAALGAFQSGATVGFGAVSVGREGVYYGKDTVPWEELEGARVSQGKLLVHSAGRKRPAIKVEVAQVRNVHVLLALVEQVRRGTA
jgi:hypothetical protein